MAYISQNEKIRVFFDEVVIPKFNNMDIDEDQLVQNASKHLNVNPIQIQKYINDLVDRRFMKRQKFLTIPEEKMDTWLADKIKEEKQIKQEAQDIMNGKISSEDLEKKEESKG